MNMAYTLPQAATTKSGSSFDPHDEACRQSNTPRWHPFATAPKTGEWFLAFTEISVGWCVIDCIGPIHFACWDARNSKFIINGNYSIADLLTHWAPFPTFPNDTQLLTLDSETMQPVQGWRDEEI